jgi:predicted GIY-YIG superfamily endonuclease
MHEHLYWVYMTASGPCGYLYVGVTNDLIRRIDEHKHGQIAGYTAEHCINQLVWYEQHPYIDQAILREDRTHLSVSGSACPLVRCFRKRGCAAAPRPTHAHAESR